jgi:hypothetical protein
MADEDLRAKARAPAGPRLPPPARSPGPTQPPGGAMTPSNSLQRAGGPDLGSGDSGRGPAPPTHHALQRAGHRRSTRARRRCPQPVAARRGLGGRAINGVERVLADLEVPERLRDVGVKRAVLPELVEQAMDDWSLTRVPRPVQRDELTDLLHAAW